MKERVSFGKTGGVSGASLLFVWDVQADSTYDQAYWCDRTYFRECAEHFVAIRTRRGVGELHLCNIGVVDTPPDSLFILQFKDLRRYRCKGDQWDFWWFQFSVSGLLHFPLEQVIVTPPDPDDEKDFLTVFEMLRHPTFLRRGYSTATFLRMLYRWTMDWEGAHHKGPHHRTILKVIQKMHDKITGNWTVREMAADARMSVSYFRRLFQDLTGQAPRKFYENLRLSMGEEFLRRGIYNVSQTSDYLGYSSPFHFSKAFRRRFGVPPSKRL